MKNINFVEEGGCSFFLSQLKNWKEGRARNPELFTQSWRKSV